MKQRNAAGVTPDVANPILPQKTTEGESREEYMIKKLKAHPAAAHASIEKIKLTRLLGLVFKYTKVPRAKLTKNAKNKKNLGIINFKTPNLIL